MTIKEFVKSLLEQGISEEEVLEALRKGDKAKGITPKKPPFDKLVLKKLMKELHK